MKIQLLVIGDELLTGQIVDMNTKWLANFLHENSLELERVQILPDKDFNLEVSFKKAIDEKYDITFVTGGLGPTKDDRTKVALAKAFGLKIVPNKESEKVAASNYLRAQRDWSLEKDAKHDNPYQFLPLEFRPINNPGGLAPGILYEKENQFICCAPGVPSEFQKMVSDEFFPELTTKLNFDKTKSEKIRIRTFGIPEEKIFYELCPTLWPDLEQFGKVSSLPRVFGVDIVVTIENTTNEKKNLLYKIINESLLLNHIWHIGEDELPELFLKKAQEKNLNFSFAESCTGGLLSSLITDISGSSSHFLGGMVTYINEAKVNLLGVQKSTLELVGAVSVETAEQMAIGSLKAYNSDMALSTSGIAGPSGGTKEKPVGTLSFGWAYRKNGEIISGADIQYFRGDRLKLKTRFAFCCLKKGLDIIEAF